MDLGPPTLPYPLQRSAKLAMLSFTANTGENTMLVSGIWYKEAHPGAKPWHGCKAPAKGLIHVVMKGRTRANPGS